MSLEFTGERVIPGQVDVDLWNEHIARYVFTARLVAGRRVLDIGCGAGYGSARLAEVAASVTALDVSADAIALAQSLYPDAGVKWTCASATDLPYDSGCFDAVVAFEVIEHLSEWHKLVSEAARVLAPGGIFVVSTPNKLFYAETRRESGPNPYHEHEFEYDEFLEALRAGFGHTKIYLQDHVEGVGFRRGAELEARAEAWNFFAPNEANFFVAVCSQAEVPEAPGLVYLPRAANAVREKLIHIERLNGEVQKKDRWLAEEQAAHQKLLEEHRAQTAELAASQEWAKSLDIKRKEQGERIVGLQQELARQQAAALTMQQHHKADYADLELTLQDVVTRAGETERSLRSDIEERTNDLRFHVDQLSKCVELLHQSEANGREQTQWALALIEERSHLETEILRLRGVLNTAASSRWVKLGRVAGVGPELSQEG